MASTYKVKYSFKIQTGVDDNGKPIWEKDEKGNPKRQEGIAEFEAPGTPDAEGEPSDPDAYIRELRESLGKGFNAAVCALHFKQASVNAANAARPTSGQGKPKDPGKAALKGAEKLLIDRGFTAAQIAEMLQELAAKKASAR